MERFHAHIYFDSTEIDNARTLALRAQSSDLFGFAQIYEKPVGPHPKAMIELHFTIAKHATAVDWLKENHGIFSVLVHQDTGDDFKDHTVGIQWLGPQLPIDFTFFELIKTRPDLRIHP